jgi:hypothetical protein
MAQLTSDIVWLVEQSTTLSDGSTQKVLVPQVYVRVKPGDIDGSGALLSGRNVDMQLQGDVLSSGTIAARQVVKIDSKNIHNLGGRISGDQVQLKAVEDINNIGGTVDAARRLELKAGGTVRVESTTRDGISTGTAKVASTHVDRIAGLYVTDPGGELKVDGKDVILKGADIRSAGSVDIHADQDLRLETLTTGHAQDIAWRQDNTRQTSTSHSVGTSISARGDATLTAGRDITGQAADLNAGRTLTVDAKRHVALEAAIDQDSAQTQSGHKSGMSHYHLEAHSHKESLNRTTLSAQNVVIKSGGDTTLSAVTIDADTLDIDAKGKLNLLAPKTQDSEGWNVTHGSSASVGAKGQGSSDETLNYNQFNVRESSFKAQGGVEVQVGQHVQLDQLAKQPGMGWVDQIRNDPKLAGSTEWQRVQEAHDQWNYRQSGMGPVSAALVAVMVSAAALPAASAAGGAAGAAAGGTSTLAGTVAAGAVKAGVLALSSQVGVSFVNNNGDLGKVFDELGSSDSVKNLAAAIITGGALAGMGFQVLPDQSNVAAGAQEFSKQLINNLQIQGTSALINTVVKGGSLEDGLKDALLAALVNSIAATTAQGIGGLTKEGEINSFTNKLVHAIAGCALGAAQSGSSGGCAGGAVGAVVGELFAEGVGSNRPSGWSQNDIVYMSGQFAGLAAALAGGDAEQVATANWAGSNAAANNRYGRSPFPEAEKAYTEAKLKFTAECGASCTQDDLNRIDAQAALAESAATKIAIAQRGGLTTEQAQQLAQTLIELAPGFGSAESLAQLVTGQSSLTGEEASRFWASIGLVPIAGGMVRKVGEPAADALTGLLKSTSAAGGTKSAGAASAFADQVKLEDHFARHGRDFGARSATEYQTMANGFLTDPLPVGVLEKTRSNGDVVRYNPTTEQFGIVTNNGAIRTYYKPDPAVHGKGSNLDYFNGQ